MIDSEIQITNQDLVLFNCTLKFGRSILVVVNKWDIIEEKDKKKVKLLVVQRLKKMYKVKVHFISSLKKIGIKELIDSISKVYLFLEKNFSASYLTKLLYCAVEHHSPGMIFGRKIKLKYANIGGLNPLKIIIHGNQVNGLSDTYKRYLINFFQKRLNCIGNPLKLFFKNSKNPYSNQI